MKNRWVSFLEEVKLYSPFILFLILILLILGNPSKTVPDPHSPQKKD